MDSVECHRLFRPISSGNFSTCLSSSESGGEKAAVTPSSSSASWRRESIRGEDIEAESGIWLIGNDVKIWKGYHSFYPKSSMIIAESRGNLQRKFNNTLFTLYFSRNPEPEYSADNSEQNNRSRADAEIVTTGDESQRDKWVKAPDYFG